MQQAVEEAASSLGTSQRRAIHTAETVAQAEAALNTAQHDPGIAERRAVELAVARLEGAVSERKGRFADLDAAVDITPSLRPTTSSKPPTRPRTPAAPRP